MTSPSGPPENGQPPAQFSEPGEQPPPPQVQPYGQRPTYAPPVRRPVSITGAVLVVIGAVGIGLAFTVLNWYHSDKGEFAKPAKTISTFSNIHKTITTFHDGLSTAAAKDVSFGVSNLYFAWLGWLLFAAAVVFGLLAISQIGNSAPVVKLIAALVAAAGVGITAWAIYLVSISGPLRSQPGNDTEDYLGYLKQTSFGAWAAGAGFLLILIGSLIPARRG
jgi:hypothetical protein